MRTLRARKTIDLLAPVLVLLVVLSCSTPPAPPTLTTTAQATVTSPTGTPTTLPAKPTRTLEPTRRPADTGLIEGEPCRPPCWMGITPGVTTMAEAETIVKDLEDQGTVFPRRIEGVVQFDAIAKPKYLDELPGIAVESFATETSDIVVYFKDDVVYSISLAFGSTNPAISIEPVTYTLETLVSLYGPPEFVWWQSGFDPTCSACDPPLALGYHVYDPHVTLDRRAAHLMYPSRGLSFWSTFPADYTGCMCPGFRFDSAQYFAPTPLNEFWYSPGEAPHLEDSAEEITHSEMEAHRRPMEKVQEWHGFGPGY
jgi:hypothetical protein